MNTPIIFDWNLLSNICDIKLREIYTALLFVKLPMHLTIKCLYLLFIINISSYRVVLFGILANFYLLVVHLDIKENM